MSADISGGGTMELPSTPEIDAVRNEARALSAALHCMVLGELTPEAERIVRNVFKVFYEPTKVSEILIMHAQARILGHTPTVELFEPVSEPTDRAIFQKTARAWIIWATGVGRREQALRELRAIPVPKGSATEGRAIHLMALHPWVLAVASLLGGNREEALRQYRRATELGAQLGTETNPTIQWTFAASFLPTSADSPSE